MSDDGAGLVIRLPGSRSGEELGRRSPHLTGVRALGFDGEYYYYLSPSTQMLVALSAAEHTEPMLLRLRPLDTWAAAFPVKGGRADFDLSRARDFLIQACHEAGIFEPTTVKGRGVWWSDDKGAIVHDGSYVTVEGKPWRPSDCPLPDVYEAGPSWGTVLDRALEGHETAPIAALLDPLPWAHPSHARLCAGWLALAGVCGALRWRPHLALTGPSSSGKSWCATSVLVPLLRPLVLHVEGETTSAGVRQTLRRDARPVVWDEAEPQGQKGQARLSEMLGLARSMSGEGQGQVLKGGARHRASAFQGSAMLCIISIHSGQTREADINRLTTLEFVARRQAGPAHDLARKRQQLALDAIAAPGFRPGLFARMVKLLPRLRETQQVFAEQAALRYKSQRAGDQVGSLLAGAWHLASDRVVTPAEAAAQVAGLPDDLAGLGVAPPDEERCLASLAGYSVRVDTSGGKRQVTRTVGQLILQGLRGVDHDEVSTREAASVLGRWGVRVFPASGEVAVANQHDALAGLFRGHDYALGWARMLERLPGARKGVEPVRFGPGVRSRATYVPGALFHLDRPPDGAVTVAGTGPPDRDSDRDSESDGRSST